MKASLRSIALVSTLAAFGCVPTLDGALDAAGRRAGMGIGNAVGASIGDAAGRAIAAQLPAMWTPNLTALYMNYLFTMAFHSGSYTFEGTDYAVGEWTRWRLLNPEEEGASPQLERAFLHRQADGKEWWRVKYVSDTEEGRDSMVVEALFDPRSGEFLRMRGKMPGEGEAREMPVEKGTYTYVEPRRLTRESLEGAIIGTENVRVPAGSYSAERVRYGGMDHGVFEWWMNESVPGGLVKYSRSYEDMESDGPDPYNWTVELVASGTNARSELGITF